LHRLGEIKAQTLVIQGFNDPLIPIEHAKKYLKFHLNAKKYYIRTMGHDMSSPILKPMINKILNFLS
jgi:pimeloyl-ACP methyl ester carboxylesterase